MEVEKDNNTQKMRVDGVKQLGEVIRIIKRTENEADSKQVLSVIVKYSNALSICWQPHQDTSLPRPVH